MPKLTLYQILRKSGLFATKEELTSCLRTGQVTIGGRVTKNQEFQCNPNSKEVCVNGKKVEFVKHKYFVLNKPFNTSCQIGDNFAYVRNLIDQKLVGVKIWNSLFCVGRLDVSTTGLLILTNDGLFSKQVLNPNSKIMKKYKVLVKKTLDESQLIDLEQGVKIELKNGEKYKCQRTKAEKISDHEMYLTICEGKFRQVRKMLEAVGNKVVRLERVAIGNLEIGDLSEGEWKEYNEEEIKKLVLEKS